MALMPVSQQVVLRYVGTRMAANLYKVTSGARYVFGQTPDRSVALVSPADAEDLKTRWPRQFLDVPHQFLNKGLALDGLLISVSGVMDIEHKATLMAAGFQTVGEVLSAGAAEVASILSVEMIVAQDIDNAIRDRVGLPKYYGDIPIPEQDPEEGEAPESTTKASPKPRRQTRRN